MAAVVSHAMRRFPTSPPDDVYSSCKLKGEGSNKPWSHPEEGGESALSRSMRYADPWLYGSVRAHGGLFLTPAFVLCACSDYVNGTKRSNKKGPTTCKKCKGTRLPLSSSGDASKFGTVRCYSTSHATATPIRAGTVRVSSSSRPSILPTADPYDLMRRSRLSVSEGTSQFRARSISPTKGRNGEIRSHSATRTKGKSVDTISSPTGRRSILECDINPYELMTTESAAKDASITFVNGQRIRVRPPSTANATDTSPEYEDVQVQTRRVLTQSAKTHQLPTTNNTNNNNISINKKQSRPSSPKLNEKESEFNRFKSILKKPATTFSDTDSNGPELSPSPSRKSGSHFYLPMPVNVPRKKVKFLVENELVCQGINGHAEDRDEGISTAGEGNQEDTKKENSGETEKEQTTDNNEDENIKKVCKLRRSVSERFTQESTKVVFHDTMALRTRNSRSDSRSAFSTNDLQRLDGLVSRTRKTSPSKPRPKEPPPPPPPVHSESEESSDSSQTKDVIDNTNGKDNISQEEPVAIRKIANSEEVKKNEPKKRVSFDEIVYKSEVFNSHSSEDNHFDEKEEKYKKCIEEIETKLEITSNVSPAEEKSNQFQSDAETSDSPPLAPPRKRSFNKQPQINIIQSPTSTVRIEPVKTNANKTIVQINSPPTVHKLQIRNEFSESSNVQSFSITENPQRKTSILINGDDCYSTVNVNDDIPLYQSSVVVKDCGLDTTISSCTSPGRGSSSIYITGNFENNSVSTPNSFVPEDSTDKVVSNNSKEEITEGTDKVKDDKKCNGVSNKIQDQNIYDIVTKEANKIEENHSSMKEEHPVEKFSEENIPTSEVLKELLKDPVEAVRRNLVPHVCGKSDVTRRQRDRKFVRNNLINESLLESPLEYSNDLSNLLEESFARLRNYESIDDNDSEHSSSTQYELMDPGSDCYTDHSNRSSVTEDELVNRTKFYELLADSNAIEVAENEDHHYESIKINSDPIYEEIEVPPPLPKNPPPTTLLDDLQLDKEFTTRSIFEGASKYDILSYLVDAKERGIVPEDSYTYNFNNTGVIVEEDAKEPFPRICHMSTVSDSSEDNSLIMTGALIEDKQPFQKTAEVERNDSGVGSETSKSSLSKYRIKQEPSLSCEDCESLLDSQAENEPLLCRKCLKKRSERKEIITEIVETEEKYSRDLQIILEEFYQPMLVAGLLTPDQLSAIFLNVEELLENSQALAERLRDAVEIAVEQGDEDLLTVNIGKLFLEAAPMLHAFETYCVRQGAASLLLASLEKDKELLRIFLRVSQMENTLLRRMNLNSFLMVPVQRVTKYPLLLARLYKVTPAHHETREHLKEAQHKIELHLNHMNSETKDIPSKLWRRIGSSSGRRISTEMDLVNIKLRKIAVDVLEWNHEEAKFALEGKLLFTQPTDNNWRKGRTIKLTAVNALLVINGKPSTSRTEKGDETGLTFSRHSGVREAALLLVRDKNGRYSLLREPLYLDRCIIAADPAWQSYFEVQELLGKDTFIFKADDDDQTRIWYRQLQHYAQGMGAWRKRRNALANIMINGMGLRS